MDDFFGRRLARQGPGKSILPQRAHALLNGNFFQRGGGHLFENCFAERLVSNQQLAYRQAATEKQVFPALTYWRALGQSLRMVFMGFRLHRPVRPVGSLLERLRFFTTKKQAKVPIKPWVAPV